MQCTVDVGIAKVTKGLRGGASKVTFFILLKSHFSFFFFFDFLQLSYDHSINMSMHESVVARKKYFFLIFKTLHDKKKKNINKIQMANKAIF